MLHFFLCVPNMAAIVFLDVFPICPSKIYSIMNSKQTWKSKVGSKMVHYNWSTYLFLSWNSNSSDFNHEKVYWHDWYLKR